LRGRSAGLVNVGTAPAIESPELRLRDETDCAPVTRASSAASLYFRVSARDGQHQAEQDQVLAARAQTAAIRRCDSPAWCPEPPLPADPPAARRKDDAASSARAQPAGTPS